MKVVLPNSSLIKCDLTKCHSAHFISEVGLRMHGVEINGKPVPISYELQNGDVVSILTGEGLPSPDWMRYAKSRSTRSKLRSYFRAQQKER